MPELIENDFESSIIILFHMFKKIKIEHGK